MTLAKKINELRRNLPRTESQQLGKPEPTQYYKEIITNTQKYKEQGLPNRTRVRLGSHTNNNDIITGFQQTTILRNAEPTIYEREHIKLEGPLTYAQLKKIFTHPKYRGEGTAKKLLKTSLELAQRHGLDWVTDVEVTNSKAIHFLTKNGIKPRFTWRTPKKTVMYRLGI